MYVLKNGDYREMEPERDLQKNISKSMKSIGVGQKGEEKKIGYEHVRKDRESESNISYGCRTQGMKDKKIGH